MNNKDIFLQHNVSYQMEIQIPLVTAYSVDYINYSNLLT